MDVANLLPGEQFAERLEKELAGCDVLLAIIGPRWLEVGKIGWQQVSAITCERKSRPLSTDVLSSYLSLLIAQSFLRRAVCPKIFGRSCFIKSMASPMSGWIATPAS